MWHLKNITQSTTPKRQVYLTNGDALNTRLGPAGTEYCLMFTGLGWINLKDIGHQDGGPHYWAIGIDTQIYWYDGDGQLEITLTDELNYTITGNGNYLSGKLNPVRGITEKDIKLFQEMLDLGIIPYRNLPSGNPKSPEEIRKLGEQYFPNDPYGYFKAYAIYDWTSADFIRFDLFKQMVYTEIAGNPLDIASIAYLIWQAYYPPYIASNADFMNMFLMKPANSEQEVVAQLTEKLANKIQSYCNAEFNIFTQAVLDLPKISNQTLPELFRGAPPMSTRVPITNRFCAQFLQFKGNAGPIGRSLEIPLKQGLDEYLQLDDIFTGKTCFSYSNNEEGAKVWQNGVLMTVQTPAGYDTWPCGADITPFSLNPKTIEYSFPLNTRYKTKKTEWITIKGKPVLHITAEMLGMNGTTG